MKLFVEGELSDRCEATGGFDGFVAVHVVAVVVTAALAAEGRDHRECRDRDCQLAHEIISRVVR